MKITKRLNSFMILYYCLALTIPVYGELSADYYKSIEGKKGEILRSELFNILEHEVNVLTYSELWSAYHKTDFIYEHWDMYSNCYWAPDVDKNTGVTIQEECISYNREHSLPKSWWGGTKSESMYSDIVHIIPTDS